MTALRHALALLASIVPASALAQAPAPTFARIFTDHAVLQRDQPIAVWGKAAPSATVSVSIGGRTVAARTDRGGHWRASLPAITAGGPYTLTASAGGATSALADVKIGDVYLCGGQSNMEFPVRLSTGAWGEVAASADDDLRFATIAHDSAPAPLADLAHPAPWQVVSPATVGEASAVCYYMARSLRKTLGVPIGFIHSSWGGTTIQSWTGGASLRTLPRYRQGVDTVALLATDPARARPMEEMRQEAWWDAHDPVAATQRAWARPDYDDSGWSASVPAAEEGVTWYRTAVTLTAEQAQAANALRLGPIDTYDTAWVNGTWVGANTIAWFWRDYPVPAGVFHAGRNVVALRVLGTKGPTGPADARGIATADGGFIPLPAAGWRNRTGSRLRGLTGPAAPWAVPTSYTTLYNAMIAPLAGYRFKLAAWYQGEANIDGAAEYRELLTLMMADWRRTLGQRDLPFLVAQLTSFGTPMTRPAESGWATLRQAQADAVAADARAGLAVTIDVGDRTDIHPSQKTVVGERLARAARAVAYGEDVIPGSPRAIAVTRTGGDLSVAFRDTSGDLRTYGAAVPTGFEACDATTCRFVSAEVRGDTVVLAGANRPEVTRVRYAWADVPFVNLFGADDLPVAPFELRVGEASARR